MNDLTAESPDSLAYTDLLQQPDLCLSLARDICRRHGLSTDCVRIEEGSQLVVSSAGRHVVKVYAPQDADFHRNEAVFLDRLHGRLPLRTPELVASGALGKLPYIIMEQIDGVPWKAAWPGMSETQRRDLAGRLGEAVRGLHALPIEPLAEAPFRWEALMEGQRAGLVEHHRRHGLEDPWLVQLEEYVQGCPGHFHSDLVPLHTELMQEHLLLERTSNGWRIAGLIDFESSQVGHREYEFCAVGVFLTRGEPGLFRRFLSSYGYPEAALTDPLSRRIMTLLLLHRYSNLKRFSKLLPQDREFTQLSHMEQYWYGL